MPDIITLEAVYDNSDIMTDYFDRDYPIQRWYVCDVQGKVITESKLRRALRLLPEWLQKFNWTFLRGEKYSISDHPYGQLRVDHGTDLRFPCSGGMGGGMSTVGFILTACTRRIFEMNDRVDNPIPPTYEAMKAFIDSKIKEREQKYREARERAQQEQKRAKEIVLGVFSVV